MAGTQPYVTRFKWDSSGGARVSLNQCQTDNAPPEANLGGVTDLYAQKRKQEQQKACLSANLKNLVVLPQGGFVVMDAGKWLDGTQDFGLISGTAAVLCEYQRQGGSPVHAPDVPWISGALKNFIDNVKGVRPKQWLPISLPNKDPDKFCVILPDLHIPQAASPAIPGTLKRFNLWNDLMARDFAGWRAFLPDSGADGSDRDYLKGRAGVGALTNFLYALAHFQGSSRAKIILAQVGDMYELWARRPLCYANMGEETEVMLSYPPHTPPHPTVDRFIAEWIAGTHFIYHELFSAFDYCAEKMRLVFVHGNHDCYLIRKSVVWEANRLLDLERLKARAAELGLDDRLEDSSYSGNKVHERQREFHENGIHLEHAHNRRDVFNHDGCPDGHEKTNQGASTPECIRNFTTWLDSWRKETFVSGASALHLRTDFKIYVMGHTHKAELRPVFVSHYDQSGKQIEVADARLVPTAAAAAP